MKTLALYFLFLFSGLAVCAQWGNTLRDTATSVLCTSKHDILNHRWMPLMGCILASEGTLFSVIPEMHHTSIRVRDAVQSDGHARLHFDDYFQYLPLATPFALELCGVKSQSGFKRMTCLTAGSVLLGMTVLEAAKFGFHKQRPDGHGYTSFPSGHTYFAFNGAEVLRREYGREYPAIAVAGYAAAVLVGCMRVYNNRHWVSDVVAGAGLGVLSVSATYWLGYRFFRPTVGAEERGRLLDAERYL